LHLWRRMAKLLAPHRHRSVRLVSPAPVIVHSAADLFPSQLSRSIRGWAWLGLVLALLLPLAQQGALRHALEHVVRHEHHEPAGLPDAGACKACTAYGTLGGGLLALTPLKLARIPSLRIPPPEPSGKIPTPSVTTRARSPPSLVNL
ncbi:MAG TPA: hypothetical protein DDW98_12635, partial [Gammaproteobacteria bacterium]|nr:hypothetical protein [Gammaproteobacteria bacterium]